MFLIMNIILYALELPFIGICHILILLSAIFAKIDRTIYHINLYFNDKQKKYVPFSATTYIANAVNCIRLTQKMTLYKDKESGAESIIFEPTKVTEIACKVAKNK